MTRSLFAIVWMFTWPMTAHAQVQPDDQTTQLVANVSNAFLDQLVQEDFSAERAFMSDRLANIASPTDWRRTRQHVIELAGKTQRYVPHGLTYYQDENLLAAVDFSGQAQVPDLLICGYMLWELSASDTIGLLRFEENVVPVETFRKLPVQEAAQTMTNWRCPAEMIEHVLGGSTQ